MEIMQKDKNFYTKLFCESPELSREEQILSIKFSNELQDIIADMEQKDYFRSELKGKRRDRVNTDTIMNLLRNIRKVTHTFNLFFDMKVDKVKQESKKSLIFDNPYGLNEDDLRFFLCSDLIFVFLQNIEVFRAALLFIMKLPIRYFGIEINKNTDLGILLWGLKVMRIKKAEILLSKIDYNLRNGLSHYLFWFDEKENSQHYLYYSKDITFQNVNRISIAELYSKTRLQSIYTNCLLNVIVDWSNM